MMGMRVDVSRDCLWLSWTSALQGELCLPILPPSIAAAKLKRAALHSEGLANIDMLTYRIWVGHSAFRGNIASALSSPHSLDSFMTAGWFKYAKGLNHPYKSSQIDSSGRQNITLRRGKKKRKISLVQLKCQGQPCFCTVF